MSVGDEMEGPRGVPLAGDSILYTAPRRPRHRYDAAFSSRRREGRRRRHQSAQARRPFRARRESGLERTRDLRDDLSDLVGLRGVLEQMSSMIGGFDVVVNNAAIYPSKPFEDYTLEEQQAVQRVNVDAGIVCVQVALPHMRKKGWAEIVNIASVTAYGGWANLSPYVQSKGALIALTRAWAREFGPYGITVNAVAPGAFPTEAEKIHSDPEGYVRFVLDHQAVKRRGRPNDIANALMFFISRELGFITGQTLNVDGGWVMH